MNIRELGSEADSRPVPGCKTCSLTNAILTVFEPGMVGMLQEHYAEPDGCASCLAERAEEDGIFSPLAIRYLVRLVDINLEKAH